MEIGTRSPGLPVHYLLIFGFSAKAHRTFYKYLSTWDSKDDQVAKEADEFIIEAINLSESFQFDHLLELPAIKQLENHPDYSRTYQLLKIFTGGNIDAFGNFVEQNKGFLEQKGILCVLIIYIPIFTK